MSRIIIIFSTVLVVFASVLLIFAKINKTTAQYIFPQNNIVKSTNIPKYFQNNTPAPNIGVPIQLIINSIGVNATIEQVGLDSEGKMDVPKGWWNVGWYNLGPKPGEKGNVVIDGHLDTPTGAAVFWNLSDIYVGDLVSVQDDKGNKYNYKVVDIKTYNYNQFPLDEVFGQTDKYRLNLITCTGVFNQLTKNYSQRVVVFSELNK